MEPAAGNSVQQDGNLDQNSRHHRHSFQHDLNSGLYPLRYPNIAALEEWKLREETTNCIEFVSFHKRTPAEFCSPACKTRTAYICSREPIRRGTGIQKNGKRPSKKLELGCPCRLVVKTYTTTPEVLASYVNKHTHELGEANAPFTRFRNRNFNAPKKVRKKVAIKRDRRVTNIKKEDATEESTPGEIRLRDSYTAIIVIGPSPSPTISTFHYPGDFSFSEAAPLQFQSRVEFTPWPMPASADAAIPSQSSSYCDNPEAKDILMTDQLYARSLKQIMSEPRKLHV